VRPIDKIRAYIEKELIRDHQMKDLKEDQSLFETGVLDSMGIIKLTAYIETEFNIKISDQELIPDNFDRLCSIEKLISQKTESRIG